MNEVRTAVLLASLLLTAGLAVAPTASATHCDQLMSDPPQACHVAFQTAEPVIGYAMCFLNEKPPLQWDDCL